MSDSQCVTTNQSSSFQKTSNSTFIIPSIIYAKVMRTLETLPKCVLCKTFLSKCDIKRASVNFIYTWKYTVEKSATISVLK